MNNVFKDIQIGIKKAADVTTQKVGEITENTKMALDIAREEGELDDLYKVFGMSVYSLSKKGLALEDADLLAIIAEIDVKLKDIEELEKRRSEMKGIKACTQCAHDNQAGARFCANCGVQLPENP